MVAALETNAPARQQSHTYTHTHILEFVKLARALIAAAGHRKEVGRDKDEDWNWNWKWKTAKAKAMKKRWSLAGER